MVDFYAALNGVWLYNEDVKLRVYVDDAVNPDTLFSAFAWAQSEGFTGPNWCHFTLPIGKYAGHKCQFEFIMYGKGGDNVAIDGFKLIQKDESGSVSVSINQGDSVHFRDLSDGHPDSWLWTFTGADITSSTEKNPVVRYSTPGVFDVTLETRKGDSQNRVTKTGFVTVNGTAPKALIATPETGYLSPWSLIFIPVGTPVTYFDASAGFPTSYNWTFTGTDIASSTAKSPTVTYNSNGLYGVELSVSNSIGTDKDFLLNAIKVGGSSDIWNITPEESAELGEISLSWYGWYAGTNWLGMRSFAEHFDRPLAESSIDTVTVYFNSAKAQNTDTEITVSVCPAVDGVPGAAIASKSLKVSELECDENYIVPTYFVFDSPVKINSEFFITITGFPNEEPDNVSVLCVYRGDGKRSTVFHEIEDEDANYQGLGTYSWYKNVDEGISMAVTAHLTYLGNANDIAVVGTSDDTQSSVYGVNGVRVKDGSISGVKPGVYVVRNGNNTRKVLVK